MDAAADRDGNPAAQQRLVLGEDDNEPSEMPEVSDAASPAPNTNNNNNGTRRSLGLSPLSPRVAVPPRTVAALRTPNASSANGMHSETTNVGVLATPRRREASGSPYRAPSPAAAADGAAGTPSAFRTGAYTSLLRTSPARNPTAPASSAARRPSPINKERGASSVGGDAAHREFEESRAAYAGVSPYLVREAEVILRTPRSERMRPVPSPRSVTSEDGTSSAGAAAPQHQLYRSPAHISSARVGGLGTSPLRRAPTASPRSPAKTGSPSASPAAFTGRWSMASREGRILTLLTEFDQRNLRPWGARVADIATRFTKLNYVAEDELRFLRHARRRNDAFLHNLKAILREAVAEGIGVDGHVARQARELTAEADNLNQRIGEIVKHANRPSATDVVTGRAARRASSRNGSPATSAAPSRSGSRESHQYQEHDTGSGRSSSKGGGGGGGGSRAPSVDSLRRSPAARANSPTKSRVAAVAPVPALSEMARPTPRRIVSAPQQQSVIEREDRRQMLEGIVALEKRSSLSPADLEWAQTVFLSLYGEKHGPTRFKAWCDELATTPLVVRPSYYAAGRAPNVTVGTRASSATTGRAAGSK